jgi:hypothetical protein
VSGNVNVDPADLARLKQNVQKARQEVESAMRDLQRAYDKTNWNDAAGQKFGTLLKDASGSVKRATQRLDELGPILDRKRADLQQYLGR